MKLFTGSNWDVALFVGDILQSSGTDFVLTTIIKQEKSEVSSVFIVTDISLVDTVKKLAQIYSLEDTDILPPNTQGG